MVDRPLEVGSCQIVVPGGGTAAMVRDEAQCNYPLHDDALHDDALRKASSSGTLIR